MDSMKITKLRSLMLAAGLGLMGLLGCAGTDDLALGAGDEALSAPVDEVSSTPQAGAEATPQSLGAFCAGGVRCQASQFCCHDSSGLNHCVSKVHPELCQ